MTKNTNDPVKRLEQAGRAPVPLADSRFADNLESRLRVQHGEQAPARRRVSALLPRLGVAVALVLVGIVGSIALTGRPTGVPVSVVEGDPIPPAEQPAVGDAGQPGVGAAVDPTPTSTIVVPTSGPLDSTTTPSVIAAESLDPRPSPSPQPPASVEPAESPTPSSGLTPAPVPSATAIAESTAPPQPAASATPSPIPSPTPSSGLTPAPVPSATAVVEPTATSQPRPSPTPEPLSIALACVARVAGDAVGVSCTWEQPVSDQPVARYQVWRSRNGGEVAVVSTQRGGAPKVYVDRDVAVEDEVAYLVRGLNADGVVIAASVREVVEIPMRD